MFPNQGHISQDTSKQRPAPHQITNNRGVDEWKEKKNRYAPPKLTPIGSSSSRLSTVSISINKSIIILMTS